MTLGPHRDGTGAEACGGGGIPSSSCKHLARKGTLIGADSKFVLDIVTILSKLEIKTHGLIMGRTFETGTVLENMVQYNVEKEQLQIDITNLLW